MTLCGRALCHHSMSRGACSLRRYTNFGIKSNCLLLIKCNTISTSKTSSFDFRKLFYCVRVCVCVRFVAMYRALSIRIFVVFYCWFNRRFNGLFTIAILIFHISISTSTALIQTRSTRLLSFNHVQCTLHYTHIVLANSVCIYLSVSHTLTLVFLPSYTLQLSRGWLILFLSLSVSVCPCMWLIFSRCGSPPSLSLCVCVSVPRIRWNNGNRNHLNQNSIHSQQW